MIKDFPFSENNFFSPWNYFMLILNQNLAHIPHPMDLENTSF